MLRYQRWLLNNTKGFYTPVIAEDLRMGAQYLLQVCVRLRESSLVQFGQLICFDVINLC